MSKCPRCGYMVRSTPRNLDQNALSHVWYPQIAAFMHLETIEAKAYCKLRFGVPILRAESEDFRRRYDALIKGRFTYEEKLELMEWFPVTSLMSKGQMSRYMSDVQQHFGAQGLILESLTEAA